MRVLVIGGSRGIGREALFQLQLLGCNPIGFARGQLPASLARSSAIPWISADVLDQTAVNYALTGVDAVIVTLGIANADLLGPVSLFSKATKVIVAGMQQKDIKRLIVVTGFGAGRSRDAIASWQKIPFGLVFGHAYRDKDIQEQIVMDSGLDWTIARPGVLTNGPLSRGCKVISEPSQWRNGLISRKSVAAFLARQVTDRTFVKRDVVLIG